jgi:hypothetical protein
MSELAEKLLRALAVKKLERLEALEAVSSGYAEEITRLRADSHRLDALLDPEGLFTVRVFKKPFIPAPAYDSIRAMIAEVEEEDSEAENQRERDKCLGRDGEYPHGG